MKFPQRVREHINKVFFTFVVFGMLNDFDILSFGIFDLPYQYIVLILGLLVLDPVKYIYRKEDKVLYLSLFLEATILWIGVTILMENFSSLFFPYILLAFAFAAVVINAIIIPTIVYYLFIWKSKGKRGIDAEEYLAEITVAPENFVSKDRLVNIFKFQRSKGYSYQVLLQFAMSTRPLSYIILFIVGIFRAIDLSSNYFPGLKFIYLGLPYFRDIATRLYSIVKGKQNQVELDFILDDSFYAKVFKSYTELQVGYLYLFVSFFITFVFFFSPQLLVYTNGAANLTRLLLKNYAVLPIINTAFIVLITLAILFAIFGYLAFVIYYLNLFLKYKDKGNAKIHGGFISISTIYASGILVTVTGFYFGVSKPSLPNWALFVIMSLTILIFVTFTISIRKIKAYSNQDLLRALLLLMTEPLVTTFLIFLSSIEEIGYEIVLETTLILILLGLMMFYGYLESTRGVSGIVMFVSFLFLILLSIQESLISPVIIVLAILFVFLHVLKQLLSGREMRIFLEYLNANPIVKTVVSKVVKILLVKPATINMLIQRLNMEEGDIKDALTTLLYYGNVSYKLSSQGEVFYITKKSYLFMKKYFQESS